ncbi:hypothetical protein [Streptomyces sp. BPTC-684]|uniref:hypothetical protein n=1 Tax=Streptomyces sp. BPTC-684 TaxID=3043734 RepID=UPI0024B1AC9A|nr:hypothetical protein [Streptomyces sp. BPTC-684]WHM40797.1 hypothetical protein QIY60_30590 [Streptomyces sp. BPTC-684]
MSDLHTLLLEQIRERDARVRDALAASRTDPSGPPPPEDDSVENLGGSDNVSEQDEETQSGSGWSGTAPVPRARSGSAMRRELVAVVTLAGMGVAAAMATAPVGAVLQVAALLVLLWAATVAVLVCCHGGDRPPQGNGRGWLPRQVNA